MQKIRKDYLYSIVKELHILLKQSKKLTQFELEHRIGISQGLLSKWKTGDKTPSLFSLWCWADALDAKIQIVPNDDHQNAEEHTPDETNNP